MENTSKAAIQSIIAQSLDYMYALVHSNAADIRPMEAFYSEFTLPPFPENVEAFYELAYLGAQLRQLQKEKYDEKYIPLFPFVGTGDNLVSELRYDSDTERLYINTYQYFENICEDLYELECLNDLGEYHQPIKDYFASYVGRTLYDESILYFQQELYMHRKKNDLIIRIDEIVKDLHSKEFPTPKEEDFPDLEIPGLN